MVLLVYDILPSSVCQGSSLPSQFVVLHRLRLFGRAAPSSCKSMGWAGEALQLPAVRVIVGSSSFRQFEQQVNPNKANAHCIHNKNDMSLVFPAKALLEFLKIIDLVALCSEAKCKALKPFQMA